MTVTTTVILLGATDLDDHASLGMMAWTPRKIASLIVGGLMKKIRIAGQLLYRIRQEIDMVKYAQTVGKAKTDARKEERLAYLLFVSLKSKISSSSS